MLVDKMLQRTGLQHERVLVEAPYSAGELHTTQQVHGDMLIAL